MSRSRRRPAGMSGVSVAAVMLILAVPVSTSGSPVAGLVEAEHMTSTAPRSGDPETLETFFDRRIPQLLRAQGIPGAAVVVVAGGRQVFANGYGHADLDRRVPVVADRTAFPIASVSKTITATAAMQLVEQGGLDLHADVNRYLEGFQVADTYPGQPVTLAHLLTHTSGFEDDRVGMVARTTESILPLNRYLATYQPRRVRPPGALPAYSNAYGYALIGYMVERVSGMSFADYVTQHVLRPLGMDGTRFVHEPSEVSIWISRQ